MSSETGQGAQQSSTSEASPGVAEQREAAAQLNYYSRAIERRLVQTGPVLLGQKWQGHQFRILGLNSRGHFKLENVENGVIMYEAPDAIDDEGTYFIDLALPAIFCG